MLATLPCPAAVNFLSEQLNNAALRRDAAMAGLNLARRMKGRDAVALAVQIKSLNLSPTINQRAEQTIQALKKK